MVDMPLTFAVGLFILLNDTGAGKTPTCDQVPVPDDGVFAAILAVSTLLHKIWLGPAMAMEGMGLITIRTVSLLGVHAGLTEIVHTNRYVPTTTFKTLV